MYWKNVWGRTGKVLEFYCEDTVGILSCKSRLAKILMYDNLGVVMQSRCIFCPNFAYIKMLVTLVVV